MGQIIVNFCEQEGGEGKKIPVHYTVEQPENLSIRIIHCVIALPESDIPNWLYPQKFGLIAQDGYTPFPFYNTSDEIFLKVPDAESFRYEVYRRVIFDENSRAASCNATESENSDSVVFEKNPADHRAGSSGTRIPNL